MRGALRVFALVVVAARLGRDLDDGEGFLFLLIAPDGDGELASLDELLDEHLVVVAERVREGLFEIRRLLDDVDADGGALRGRLDDDGQAEVPCDLRREVARGELVGVVGMGARRRDALGDEDALGGRLVHRDGGSEDARARVGDAEHVERALQHAVLAEFSVQRVEDDGGVRRLDFLSEGLWVELHADGGIALRLEGAQDGRARLAGDGRFRRGAAHDDDDLIFFHFVQYSFPKGVPSARLAMTRTGRRTDQAQRPPQAFFFSSSATSSSPER